MKKTYASRVLSEDAELRSGDFIIIEHLTRGYLTELEYEGDGPPTPHFSFAALATDERVEKFFHVAQARRMLTELPDRVLARCSLRVIEGRR